MLDVTSHVIDNVNNFITEEQHINEHLKVFQQAQFYYVYINECQVLFTPSATKLVEFILQNFINEMEGLK